MTIIDKQEGLINDTIADDLKDKSAKFISHQSITEKAILVHLNTNVDEQMNDLEEFKLLALSAGASISEVLVSSLPKMHAKYLLGTGKAQQIAQIVEDHQADIVLFNHNLTPSQERNLERLFGCRVVDRTGLILDIFAKRARTHEAALQVELAQLVHLSTRLVRSLPHLSRQKGGIGLRGPGETRLETDRRLIQVRMTQLRAKLDKVKKSRRQGRARRQKSDVFSVSLVGYTNAGKSTLFNHLTDDNIYAANQLFATLDPTLRSVDWQGVGKVVLADTVGFIKNLDHELVESFHATLEEVLEADLLLLVVDASSPNVFEEIDAVNQVLNKIGATVPILMVYNKIDKTCDTPALYYKDANTPQRVYVSAIEGVGIDELKRGVMGLLVGTKVKFDLIVDFGQMGGQGGLVNHLHNLGAIEEINHEENAIIYRLSIAPSQLKQLLGEYRLDANKVLAQAQALLLKEGLENFEG